MAQIILRQMHMLNINVFAIKLRVENYKTGHKRSEKWALLKVDTFLNENYFQRFETAILDISTVLEDIITTCFYYRMYTFCKGC